MSRIASYTLLLVIVSFAAVTASASQIAVPESSAVSVTINRGAKVTSSEGAVGDMVVCYLSEALIISGVEVLKKGTKCIASISEVEKSGARGKPGMIALTFEGLYAEGPFYGPSKEPVVLEGVVTAKGKAKKTLSYILGFGFFIKGGQGKISLDSSYTAIIPNEIILSDQKPE